MASYETIVLGEDGYDTFENFSIGSGESFTNKLIDVTHPDAHFKLNGVGDGWRIANIGIRGQMNTSGIGKDDGFIAMNFETDGGEGVVENIFWDIRSEDRDTGCGTFRLRPGHEGHVTIRNTFVAGTGNNAIYGSSVGKNGSSGGNLTLDSCYHRDNIPANFRIGARGHTVKNCVSISDDPGCTRGLYPCGNGNGCIGVWANHCPDMHVENTSFYFTDRCNPNAVIESRYKDKSDCGESVVHVRNCHFGGSDGQISDMRENNEAGNGDATIVDEGGHTNNPTVEVLQNGGVPLNPEMAARGEVAMPPEVDTVIPIGGINADGSPYDPGAPDPGNGGGGSQPGQVLSVSNSGSDRTEYEFTVEGTIAEESGIGTGDSVTDNGDGTMTASGFVRGGEDQWRVDGSIACFSVSGAPGSFSLGGSTLDPSQYSSCDPSQPPEQRPKLTIGSDSSDPTEYVVILTGGVREEGSIENDDEILALQDGRTAVRGTVSGDVDSYSAAVGSSVDCVTVSGPAPTINFGSNTLDPANFADCPSIGSGGGGGGGGPLQPVLDNPELAALGIVVGKNVIDRFQS